MKELTVIVPAYNAEKTLQKCLDSMAGQDKRLEIIIVDDGSTDGTRAIAEDYAQRWPDEIQVLSKPNGGHGSGINRGLEMATGRYFKPVDADDWIETENLGKLLDALEQTVADAAVLSYRTVNLKTGKVQSYPSECRYSGQEVGPEQLVEVYEEISSCCSFHGLLYRTDMYREAGIRLSEGIFYEDHEYATLPMACAKRIAILPIFFYVYTLGTDSQSVAFPNQVRRIGHIEQVTRSILAYRAEHGPLSPARDEYFLRILSVIVVSYFAVALVKNPDRKTGEADARRYYTWLETEEPELLRRTAKKYRTLQWMHRLHFSADLYQWLKDSAIYKHFKKIWTN